MRMPPIAFDPAAAAGASCIHARMLDESHLTVPARRITYARVGSHTYARVGTHCGSIAKRLAKPRDAHVCTLTIGCA
jgi:hypothetical protein